MRPSHRLSGPPPAPGWAGAESSPSSSSFGSSSSFQVLVVVVRCCPKRFVEALVAIFEALGCTQLRHFTFSLSQQQRGKKGTSRTSRGRANPPKKFEKKWTGGLPLVWCARAGERSLSRDGALSSRAQSEGGGDATADAHVSAALLEEGGEDEQGERDGRAAALYPASV